MSHKLSRSEQSRLNGAKSKGPTSIEGKARSSANALRHGFAAVINVVLRIEDKPAFDRRAESLRASFKPNDYAEQMFVEQLTSISWRQSRLVAIETALIDAQIDIQHDHVCSVNPEAGKDPYFHLVQAWQALARPPHKPDEEELKDASLPPDGYDINSLELVRRYQTSLDRQFRNTLLNLRQYRQDFGSGQPPSHPLPPEPPPTEPQPEDKAIPLKTEEPKEPEASPLKPLQIAHRPAPLVVIRPARAQDTPETEG